MYALELEPRAESDLTVGRANPKAGFFKSPQWYDVPTTTISG